MDLAQRQAPLRLPSTLEAQLRAFRRRVRAVKMAEAAGLSAFAAISAYLCVFALDRLGDTPSWLRLCILVGAACGCAIVPLWAHRWFWRLRRMDRVARLLGAKSPRLGDQLLGIIELAQNDGEQARSRALCEAAIRHVAEDARKHDLSGAVPDSRHRAWGWLSVGLVAAAAGLGVVLPSAAANAWHRFLAPWDAVPRYTFAAVDPLADEIVVPHGEPFSLSLCLQHNSAWQPGYGQVQLAGWEPLRAPLREGRYQFELPSQITETPLRIRVGDWTQAVRIKPVLRPELTSIAASVSLPRYLGRTQPLNKDVRGGSVSLVKGSVASFLATASRTLSAASVNGRAQTPEGQKVRSPAVTLGGSQKLAFEWQDEFGLSGKEPFTLALVACDDEAPLLACEDLPRSKVVLDSEQINFRVKAEDDFGVKQVGIEWNGLEGEVVERIAKGQRMLAAGGYERTVIEARGTFSAASLGIEPQPVQLRAFAEDYLPGRKRVYSPTYVLYVLSPEQHAIWITEQLGKWHRQSLEVRDRELQLHETNRQLRNLPAAELDCPETRRQIENQAAAERANSRRLSALAATGEDLLRQASRNPQLDAGHLDRWAEMLQILKDIAARRMPSVADLLAQSAKARTATAARDGSHSNPKAGKVRAGGAAAPADSPERKTASAGVPQVVDVESSLQPANKKALAPNAGGRPSQPSLRLPATTLIGQAKDGPACPAGEKLEEAVRQQQNLLAEFEKIANELNNILANLEGSTLVKRLKAASREQYRVAARISDLVADSFGAKGIGEALQKPLDGLSAAEAKSSQTVSLIMDDLQAYFERRRFMKFQTVLQEMRTQDVIGALRQLADDLPREPGLSIAQCEYWWDTMDRWAEDLVDPACSGMCQGGGARGSLPPSIVLEVLKILEAEVNLREETRVAEQAKGAVAEDQYRAQAGKLAGSQRGLKDRIVKVNGQIRELPDGRKEFAREIKLLEAVAAAMDDAAEILARPETGPPAIGAETEAIELLLQSRRINPRGGGGTGGSSPGGGGGGTTANSALALLGIGINEKEVRVSREVRQSVGRSGRRLPEEFRAGLDQYFSRLEERDAKGAAQE